MAKNKLPAELHIVRGTTGINQGVTLPDKVRMRVPAAEWLDNPELWDEKQFIRETSDFLFDTYGIGSNQDKHLLAMLADQITIYIACKKGVQAGGIVAEFNNGKTFGANPYVSVMKDTLNKIVVLMNELGLTPKGRLSHKAPEVSEFTDLMQGVQIKK